VMTTPTDYQRLVIKIARAYKRKCWWADEDDMRQEANLAIVKACRSYDAEKGDFERYAWRAAKCAIQNWLLEASAPVTAPQDQLFELVGLHRAELHDEAWTTTCHMEAMLDEKHRAVKLRYALLNLCEGELERDVAWGLFIREDKSAELSATLGVPTPVIYRVAERLRRRVMGNRALYNLWKEA